MRAILPGCVLAALYVAVLGSLEPLDLLIAALVAGMALRFSRGFREEAQERPPLHRRVLGAPGWALAVARQTIVGTAQVIRQVIRPRAGSRAGIVAVPYEERSQRGVALGALVLTLSPGDMVVEMDDAERIMWIHVMDAEDPDGVRERHSRLYRDHQRRVVP